MKLLILFAFGVLFGSVYCDSKCFNKKFVTCAQYYIKDIEKVYSSCDALKQQARCVYSAALECETSFIPEAYWYGKSVEIMCGKTADYIESYRKCFARAINDSNCQNKYEKIMKDKTTPKEILGGLKDTCKQMDWFGRCLQTHTEDYCGGTVSDYFYDTVVVMVLRLQKLLCTEVLFPADESIYELAISGLPRIMELMIALLNVP
ncbi:hypothetical protein AVEN_136392-1 [Araneus ventricosus]|uniref:DUF19 domain-containing protein n=1 Tax=Araneus ventricosus TaxID=182803 RepID=A0A4Y2MZK9_ARAVE|nr:hypothetical protein AVEN_136392-1 [Araneus ventricosus]